MTRLVAIGGGHGLAASLRALRTLSGSVSAIVSVADDGGSSGRLREQLGVVAPGDLRKCLVALSDPASPLAKAFEHRFEAGDLKGHPLGNLMIVGMTQSLGGIIPALRELEKLLGCVGKLYPATEVPVRLEAEVSGERSERVKGQVAVAGTPHISRVILDPEDPEVPKEAISVLHDADAIVIGPGSLYTSVLAVASIPRIREAISESLAQKIYVCNLRPQPGETEGYDVASHLRALSAHGIVPDITLYDPAGMSLGKLEAVFTNSESPGWGGLPKAVAVSLAKANGLAHDPGKLAEAVARILENQDSNAVESSLEDPG